MIKILQLLPYNKSNVIGIICGICASIIWSCFPYFTKNSIAQINVLSFLILKIGISVMLFSYLIPGIIKKMKETPWYTLIIILLTQVIYNLLQALSLLEVSGSLYIIAFSCAPLITLIFSSGKKTISIIISFLLGFIGCVIFIASENIGPPPLMSIIYLTISVLAWVIVTLYISNLQKIYNDSEISYIFNFSSMISILAIFPMSSSHFIIPSFEILTVILFLAIASPFALILFSFSLRKVPFFGIASQYIQLISGLMIGYYFYAEIPNLFQYIGAMLIILALILNSIFSYD